MFHVCYCILTNFFNVVMLLEKTNAPYSHDGCIIVLMQLLSVRGASQPYVSWVSLQLQEAFQTGDAHHGSIGKMFTWWNWHNCFPRHSSLHSHLWKACHKQLWNHQSNPWWKWKPRNDVWDRGTVDFGLVNFVIYIPSQFNTCYDPVFLPVYRWYV